MMRASVVLALAALVGGCSFGFGSPYVGQWRAHEAAEFEVCVENDAGECVETTEVTTQKPARKFWGFAMSYPMVGLSFPTIEGETKTSFRMDINGEYLRGHGRWAIGLRTSAVIDLSSDAVVTVPIMAMGHLGLSERLSFYAGAGMSPYNSYTIDAGDEDSVTFNGGAVGRILGGMQVVGSRSQRDARILYTLEADTSAGKIDSMSYRSWGLTLSIGVFL